VVFRYGVVVLMLTTAILFGILSPPSDWGRFVSTLLALAAISAALSRAGVSRRLLGVAIVVGAVAVFSGVAAFFGGRYALGVAQLAAAGLLVLVPVAILAEFRRDLSVTLQSVTAAVCIYLVFGMFFASLASAVSTVAGAPYFVGKGTADSSDYLYFSFITLATVGYGDYVPALGAGRAMAVLEALMGQLYLVTVVALVVGNLAGRRPDGSRDSG